jgi:iron-sulfur cluster assembly accessory protein
MNTTATAESVISVTPAAAGQIQHLLAENPGRHLRVYVERGGCSGMQYGLVFDEKRAEDLVTEMHGVAVVVDPVSAGHLRGSVVDFSDSLNDGGFKITNPNARQSCGCGKSFEA